MNKLVSGAIGVEVPLLQNVSRIYFPDVVDLRKKRIKHIDMCSSQIISTTPKGNAVYPYAAESMFLTLVENATKTELVKSLPVTELNQNGNRMYINKVVDLPRCYVDISAIDNAEREYNSLYFVIWFDEPRVWGNVSDNDKLEIMPLEITLKGSRTYFDTNNTLKNRRFQNLLLSFPSITPHGNDGITKPHAVNKYLTLKRGNLEFFQRVPILYFYQSEDYYFLRLQDIIFDFQTSYIESMETTADDLKTVFFNAVISR